MTAKTVYITGMGHISTEALNQFRCGCFECDSGPRLGHFACEAPSETMLAAEKRGEVVRDCDDNGRWRWFATAATAK